MNKARTIYTARKENEKAAAKRTYAKAEVLENEALTLEERNNNVMYVNLGGVMMAVAA